MSIDPEHKLENEENYRDPDGRIRVWDRENDMFDLIREVSNSEYPDIISKVHMFDQFYAPSAPPKKPGKDPRPERFSRAYRIHYSPPDPNLCDPGKFTELVNALHVRIGENLAETLGVTVR